MTEPARPAPAEASMPTPSVDAIISSPYRFAPRFRGFAWGALGVALLGCSLAAAGAQWLQAGLFGLGVGLAIAYLRSPTWQLRVIVDEHGIYVASPHRVALACPWADVVNYYATPEAGYLDGGTAANSLLIPGPGAPAGYAIAGRHALLQTVETKLPPDRVHHVAELPPRPSASQAA